MTARTAIRLSAGLLLAVISAHRAASQIQISQLDIEGLAGKFQASYRAVDPSAFDISASGPNRLWDLSGFAFGGTPDLTVTHYTFPTAGAPDVSNPAFAQANYAIKNESASSLTWQYAKVSPAGVEVIGNIDTATAVLTPGLKILGAFPIGFGSTWSSSSSVSSSIIPAGFTATIDAAGSIDSWGTMVIPVATGGTVSKSVLRLKLEQTTTFRMSFIILYQFSSVNYQWLGASSDGQFYVAAVSTDSVGGVRTLSVYSPFNAGPVSVAYEGTTAAGSFELLPNYPNPFNPETVIPFVTGREGHVSLKVYNLLGQHLTTLLDGQLSAGRHEARLDAHGYSSGLYVVRLEAGGSVLTRTITLLR